MLSRIDEKEKRWDNERVRLAQNLDTKENHWNDERKALMREIETLRKNSADYREALAASEAKSNAVDGKERRRWSSLSKIPDFEDKLDMEDE